MAPKKSGDFCPFLGDLTKHISSNRAVAHRQQRSGMESSRDGFTWRAGFLQCAVPIDEIVHAHWCATLASDRLCSPR
jgi:hypothetical protein